jgi:hypothetical protein
MLSDSEGVGLVVELACGCDVFVSCPVLWRRRAFQRCLLQPANYNPTTSALVKLLRLFGAVPLQP